MPIYELECPVCGDRFERLQKLSDPDPTECPHCGAGGVKRALTAPAFRLSGSGWYETDFKKDGDKKRNLADKGDGPKTDAKPAAEAPKAADAAKPSGESAKPKEPTKPKPAKSADG